MLAVEKSWGSEDGEERHEMEWRKCRGIKKMKYR